VLTTSALKKKKKQVKHHVFFHNLVPFSQKKTTPCKQNHITQKKKHTGFQLSINISPSKKKKDVPSSHEKTRKELQNI